MKVPITGAFGRSHVALWLILLAALVAAGAYWRMFIGFQPYDDEGTLLAPIQQYLGGMKIYRDIYTFYGPVYYFYNYLIHALTSMPVTHDVTRMSSLFPWVACCLLAAGITLRLTGSLVLAAAGLTFVSRAMFFYDEPGHPQELTLLLLMALTGCPLWALLARRRTSLMFAMGCLAAALLLIKINVGVFVLAALALALLAHSPSTRWYRYLAYALGAGCMLLPAALMFRHLDAVWAQTYCLLATASIAAAVFCLIRPHVPRRPYRVTWRDGLVAAGGCALTVAAVLAVLAMQQVSPSDVIASVVFLPARMFSRNHFLAPRFSALWTVWGLIGLGAALWMLREQPAPDSARWRRLLWLKAAVTGAAALAAIALRADILPMAAPFAWLVLFNPDPATRDAQEFPRTVLCSLTVMQTLYGYPVYGSQGRFVQILLLIVVAVCVGDSLAWLTSFGARPAWFQRHGRAIAIGALAALAALILRTDLDRYRSYRSLTSLDLPGAHRIHVDSGQQQELAVLVADIERTCDVLESLPGLPSLNIWSGKKATTELEMNFWMLGLSAQEQARIVQALAAHPRACVVYNPAILALWNSGGQMDFESLPLVQYIRQGFRPIAASGEYRLLIHKERSDYP